MQFAIDKRPWQAVSDKAIRWMPDRTPSTSSTASGRCRSSPARPCALKIPISQVEQLARAGLDSFGKNDFKKAQRA